MIHVRPDSVEAEFHAPTGTNDDTVTVDNVSGIVGAVAECEDDESDEDDHDVTEDIFHPIQVLRKRQRKFVRECSSECCVNAIKGKIPALQWMPRYRIRSDLLPDVLAGAMLAVVCIPQGMAYAALASLAPIIGLYSCLMPSFVYAFLGCSPSMHIGPFALVSLLVATSLSLVAPAGAPVEYIQDLAFLFAILVGLVLILMSVLRLGFAVSFLADCVLSAYTCAAAILILTSQWKSFLGLSIPTGLSFLETYAWILSHLGSINLCALLLGAFSVLLLLFLDEVNSRYKLRIPIPSQLVAVLVGILICYSGGLDVKYGLRVVGHIPSGLPSIRFPGVGTYINAIDGSNMTLLSLANLKLFMQPVAMIALIAYIISISIAKNFAMKENEKRAALKEKLEAAAAAPPSSGAIVSSAPATLDRPPLEIDANQELFALGMANLLGGFVSAYPAAGSLSRSALVYNADVRSGLHNAFAGMIIIFVLLVLTPTLYYLPSTVLAAIVFTALKSLLLQVTEGVRLYHLRKQDFLMWSGTFVATVLFDVQVGIAVGLIISLLMLLKQTSRPPVATLGRLDETDLYRNIRRFPGAITYRGILIWRFDGPLHFANKDFFRAQIGRHVAKAQQREWRKIHPELDASSTTSPSIPLSMRFRSIGTTARKLVGSVGGHLKRAGTHILLPREKTRMREPEVVDAPSSVVRENAILSVHSSAGSELEEKKGDTVDDAGEILADDQSLRPVDHPLATPSGVVLESDVSVEVPSLSSLTFSDCQVRWIVLDCGSLIDVDDAALKMIATLPQQVGATLLFASLNSTVRDLLGKAKFFDGKKNDTSNPSVVGGRSRVPKATIIDRPFATVHEATNYAIKRQQEEPLAENTQTTTTIATATVALEVSAT